MYIRYFTDLLAAEVSRVTRYVDELLTLDSEKSDIHIFEEAECTSKSRLQLKDLSNLEAPGEKTRALFLHVDSTECFDFQRMFLDIKKTCSRSSRLILISENYFFQECKSFIRHYFSREETRSIALSRKELENLAQLSGFEIVRHRPIGFVPWHLGGLGTFINSLMTAVPFIRRCAIFEVSVLRPIIKTEQKPSLSIVIPARDERDNIRPALERLPKSSLGEIEIIFVEGHSSDGTWEEIQKVSKEFSDRFAIKLFQQTGIGKADAVRLGFFHAEHDLLTILDADLTMPPELLPRFYEAYVESLGDFINGNRLLYPMESQAMKFLNRIGNGVFAVLLSFVLEHRLGDSLCGTKLFSRADYKRMIQWRKDFGDFDPFGDFELLFPAATLGLGIVDMPIRYRDRVYGSTSIHRFRHGLMLLRMTIVGFFKLRMS